MPNNPLKVVVADDDPAMRRSLCAALRAAGYAVEEARDGEQAVRMFRERQTDLVLLDINMPGIGGICLLYTSVPAWAHLPAAAPVYRSHSALQKRDVYKRQRVHFPGFSDLRI